MTRTILILALACACAFGQMPQPGGNRGGSGGGASFTVASQAEAEAGVENTKGMTPLRVSQAILALAPGASYAAGPSGAIAIDTSGTPDTIDVTAAVPLKAGANDFTGANTFTLLELPNAAGAPAATGCDEAAEYYRVQVRTDGAAGQKVYVCTSGGWELQGGGGGGATLGTGGYIKPFQTLGTGDPYQTDGENWPICSVFTSPYTATITKVAIRITTVTTTTKGYDEAIYGLDLAQLAHVSGVASSTGNKVLTWSAPLSLVAGTSYIYCHADETGSDAAYPLALDNTANDDKALMSLTGGTDTLHFVGNAQATGSGVTFAIPNNLNARSGSTNRRIPAFILLP